MICRRDLSNCRPRSGSNSSTDSFRNLAGRIKASFPGRENFEATRRPENSPAAYPRDFRAEAANSLLREKGISRAIAENFPADNRKIFPARRKNLPARRQDLAVLRQILQVREDFRSRQESSSVSSRNHLASRRGQGAHSNLRRVHSSGPHQEVFLLRRPEQAHLSRIHPGVLLNRLLRAAAQAARLSSSHQAVLPSRLRHPDRSPLRLLRLELSLHLRRHPAAHSRRHRLHLLDLLRS